MGRKKKPGPKPVKKLWRRFYYKKTPRKSKPIVVNGRTSLLIRHGAEDTEVIKRIGFDRFRFQRWGGNLKRRTKQVRGELIVLMQEYLKLFQKHDVQFILPKRLYAPLQAWVWKDGKKIYVERKCNYYTFVWMLDMAEQLLHDDKLNNKQRKKGTVV